MIAPQSAMIGRLADALTLSRLDSAYKSALKNSMVVAPLLGIFDGLKAKLKLTAPGNLMQKASLVVLCLLFVCLGLPQFASDKEGLALVSLLSLAFFVIGRLLGGSRGREPKASDSLVLGYFAANVIATFASHYLPESIKGLSKIAVYILAYFLFTASLQGSRRNLLSILTAAIGTGLLVSLYGLYQYKIGVAPLATWEDPSVESKGTRVFSTLGNPNLLAGYLIPLVPLATSLGLMSLVWPSKWKWLTAPLALGSAAVIGLATVLTGSRGGYLSLGAMAGCMVVAFLAHLIGKRPRLVLPTLIAVIVLAVGGALAVHFFAPSFEQRIESIFAGSSHSSNAYRMYVWNASLRMFEDNWWFGVGPGNTAFRLAYGLYMTSGFDALGTYCVPLEVGVECGVIGLLFFGALIACAFACGHIVFWQKTPGEEKTRGTGLLPGSNQILALGLTAALVGLSVQGMVDTVFYRPQVQFLFWLVVAALVELRSNDIYETPATK